MKVFMVAEQRWFREQARLAREAEKRAAEEAAAAAEAARLAAIAGAEAVENERMAAAEAENSLFLAVWAAELAAAEARRSEARERAAMAEEEDWCRAMWEAQEEYQREVRSQAPARSLQAHCPPLIPSPPRRPHLVLPSAGASRSSAPRRHLPRREARRRGGRHGCPGGELQRGTPLQAAAPRARARERVRV